MRTLLLDVTTVSGSHVQVFREEDFTFSIRRVSDAPVADMDGRNPGFVPREHRTYRLSVVIVHNGRVVAYRETPEDAAFVAAEVYRSTPIAFGVDHTTSATYAQFHPLLRCDALGTVIHPVERARPAVLPMGVVEAEAPQRPLVEAIVGAFGGACHAATERAAEARWGR
jgi:hypothetical protein